MVENIRLGVVSTATRLLNMKLTERNTSRILETLKRLKLEIVSLIIGSSNSIHDWVKLENFHAMIKATKRYGKYKS